MSDPVIGVVGLGRLGVCLAAVLSDSGFTVWGADRSSDLVAAVNRGEPPNGWEPGVTALVQEWCMSALKPGPFGYDAGNVLVAGTDTAAMAEQSDVVFVVVPTPSLPSGEFDDMVVRQAVAYVCGGFLLRDRPGRPIIVITSTVMPGTCDAIAAQMKRASPDIDAALVYNPAFIALGSVIADLRSPDVVLIGGELGDADAMLTLLSIWQEVAGDAPKHVVSRCEAETAKLAVNLFLSVKSSFANTVARICERLPGVDAGNVLDVVGADHRIGPAFLRHGAPARGPCLPRDVRAWSVVAHWSDATADFSGLIDAATSDCVDWFMDRVLAALMNLPDEPRGHADVAVLGLGYKADAVVADDSLGLMMCEALAFEGVDFCAHDPNIVPDPATWATLEQAMSCPVVVDCTGAVWDGITVDGAIVIDAWSNWLTVPGRTVIRPGVHGGDPRR